MTISDAYVLAMCDRTKCRSDEEVGLSFVYHNYSGKSGQYDHSDDAVEQSLLDKGWVIRDGSHFCCEDCADWDAEDADGKAICNTDADVLQESVADVDDVES